MALMEGLEPPTLWLTATCTTDCATPEYLACKRFALLSPPNPAKCPQKMVFYIKPTNYIITY